jgi:hypothetical protein
MKWLVIAATLMSCDRKPPLQSCNEPLHGVWRTATGARWMVLDRGATLEAFPLFDDGVAGGAPRAMDLKRAHKLAGEVVRRYMQGGASCESRAAARITSCRGSELELVLADPQPPLSYEPCAWGQPAPSRVERWHRE